MTNNVSHLFPHFMLLLSARSAHSSLLPVCCMLSAGAPAHGADTADVALILDDVTLAVALKHHAQLFRSLSMSEFHSPSLSPPHLLSRLLLGFWEGGSLLCASC